MEENTKRAIAFFLLGCFVISLTATSATAKTYKLGDGQYNVGDQEVIKKYEQCLDALGYNPGPVDGYFSEETENAVILFQEDYGITATGQIGGATHIALKKASPAWAWYGNQATADQVINTASKLIP